MPPFRILAPEEKPDPDFLVGVVRFESVVTLSCYR